MLARLFTPTRVRLLILGALVLTVVVVWLARRAAVVVVDGTPAITATTDSDLRGDLRYEVVGDEPPPQVRVTKSRHRVTRIHDTYGCGYLYVVTPVQYDDVTLIVPCIEFLTSRGLRFAVGTEHEFASIPSRLLSITQDGVRYDVEQTTVVAPRDVFDHLEYSFDNKLHYRAPGFRWDQP